MFKKLAMLLLLIPFALADFNYYDDFTNLNQKVWLNKAGTFDIHNGELRCNPNGESLTFLEFLPFDDFNSKDWTLEFNLTWQDKYAANVAVFMDDKNTMYTSTETYQQYSNYREGTLNVDLYFDETISDTNYNHDYMTNYLPGYTGVYRYEKTNLPNGHYNVKMYRGGVLYLNMDSFFDWQHGELADKANRLYLPCDALDNTDWRIDWINITIMESSYQYDPDPIECKTCGSSWKHPSRPPTGVPEFSTLTLLIAVVAGTVGLLFMRKS